MFQQSAPRSAAARKIERTSSTVWVQCDSCSKWRRLPERMRDSDELEDAWTCAMHPDPAIRNLTLTLT